MITPVFEITQDDTFLYIVIKAPYSKVSDADVYIDGEDFKFYAKPYFLRLKLPGSLLEDDRAKCKYDADKGEYKLKIAKETPGLFFQDLEMLTKLLAPSGDRELKQPLVEFLDDGDNENETELNYEFDWSFPQTYQPDDLSVVSTGVGNGYGFADQKSGIFGKLQEDLHDVLQVKNLEHTTSESRFTDKIQHENEKFDPDHYLADFYEDGEIQRLIKLRPPWKEDTENLEFTEKEIFTLKNLPNKGYILEKDELQSVYLGLVDILFSYAHNWRCTEGENSVESAWNTRTLSSTLSWCTSCSNIRETVISSYRRVLVFPLYRNWKLAKTCHKDVVRILSQGKKFILKCLLEIYELFINSDPYYILDDLYIRDYCIWVQKASSVAIESLTKSLKGCKVEKQDVELDLVELEDAAHLVLEEEEEAESKSKHEADTEDIIRAVSDIKL